MEKLEAHYVVRRQYTDHYLVKGSTHIRYRDLSSSGELTIKEGTSTPNTRQELNLRVSGQDVENVKSFLYPLGYRYEFFITKNSHMFTLNGLVITYDFITANNNTVDVVEIEMTEDGSLSDLIYVTEILSKKLPLSPLSQSNFDRFRPY
jgi:CYTH domain-containing protein